MTTEYQKFDAGMRKVIAVSHEELKRREEEWKREHPKKQRTKKQPASRVSSGKG